MVVSAAGAIENESDYYPWGGELKITAADAGNHYKFTGKERDPESGLDYFGARYYGNALGRWTSPDTPFADQHPENPQSWNLYMYAGNRPTSLIDTDGREVKETVTYVYYDVHGKTAAEAHANALQASPFTQDGQKFEGGTQPTQSVINVKTSETVQGFEGVAVTDTMTVKSADVKLDQTVTLPNWVEADKASPEDQAQWKTEIGDLKEHEDGHVKINSEGAHQLDKSLPGTKALGSGTTGTQAHAAASKKLSAAVTRKTKENVDQTNQQNVDYDKKTAHGLKQHEQQQ
jgi:RHS repeat-associated protein